MNNPQILIIDDEPQIRKLLEISLESNDYKIISAENAKQGILSVSYTHLDVYKRQVQISV